MMVKLGLTALVVNALVLVVRQLYPASRGRVHRELASGDRMR